MKKQTLMLGIFATSLITSPAQIAYGPQVSAVYSRITLTGADDGLETTGSGIGYQAGLFLRKDFRAFYLEADALYTGNVGGTYVYGSDELGLSASFASVTGILGKKFFPGIRLFAGIASYFLLGTDPELDIAEFIQPSGGWHEGGGTMINFVLGAGLDVSKLTISLRYEPSMLGNFHKHELLDDEVLHHIPMLSLGLAFRLN